MDEQEDTAAYRIYVTDCLAALCQTNKRYYDIVYAPVENKPADNRTGEEMVDDVVKKLGLKVTEKEGGENE